MGNKRFCSDLGSRSIRAAVLGSALLLTLAWAPTASAQCVCPPGSNIIDGTSGADSLVGTSGDDCIRGFNGNDRLAGRGGNDVICGGKGNDLLVGGAGDDLIYGEGGADTIRGGAGNDEIYGGGGGDDIRGGNGDDRIHGENGKDILRGGDGSDMILGGASNDDLFGNGGNDFLDGEAGNNNNDGGAGTDTCLGDPTPVNCEHLSFAVVTDIGMFAHQGQPVVFWKTSTESATLGFELVRIQKDTGFPSPVPHGNVLSMGNSAQNALQGSTYYVVDPSGDASEPGRYAIIETDLHGAKHRYGPFEVNRVPAPRTLPQSLLQEGHLAVPHRQIANITPEQRAPRTQLLSNEKPAAVYVKIASTGVVQIDASDLATWFDHSVQEMEYLIQTQQLGLTMQGQPIAWKASSDGRAVLTFARVTPSIYDAHDRIRITLTPGLTLSDWDGTPTGVLHNETYRATVHAEEDVIPALNVSPDPTKDFWFYKALAPSYGLPTTDLPFTLESTVPDAASATIQLRVYGGQTENVPGEHRIRVELNGTHLDTIAFEGIRPFETSFTVEASDLREGQNNLHLVAEIAQGATHNTVYVDGATIEYTRSYDIPSTPVEFTGALHHNLHLTHAAGDVRILDISNPHQVREVINVGIAGTESSHSLSFTPERSTGTYFAFTESDILSPDGFERDFESDLRNTDNNADHLVITPSSLASEAVRLVNLRNSTRLGQTQLRSMLVNLSDIYDEFSHGRQDPNAIRAFLRYAHQHWERSPRYVVLVGVGTYDYKDTFSMGDNLMPIMLAQTPNGLFASDLKYADILEDDWIPELAVGRLPVRTPTELAGLITKMEQYEQQAPGGWSSKVTLMSDNADRSHDFSESTKTIAGQLSQRFETTHVNQGDFDFDTARDELFAALNGGSLIARYNGHGGADRLSTTGWMTRDDMDQLKPSTELPFFVVSSCTTARFDIPGYDSLGARLVHTPNRGGIALFGPAGVSVTREAEVLTRHLTQLIANEHIGVIGDAAMEAVRRYRNSDESLDTVVMYNLLGDPALHLNTPYEKNDPAEKLNQLHSATSASLASNPSATENYLPESNANIPTCSAASGCNPLSGQGPIVVSVALLIFLGQRQNRRRNRRRRRR